MPVLLVVGPKMYAGRVACCLLVSDGEYADKTDGRTDARPLHYAFLIWTRSAYYAEFFSFFDISDAVFILAQFYTAHLDSNESNVISLGRLCNVHCTPKCKGITVFCHYFKYYHTNSKLFIKQHYQVTYSFYISVPSIIFDMVKLDISNKEHQGSMGSLFIYIYYENRTLNTSKKKTNTDRKKTQKYRHTHKKVLSF